VAGLRILVVNAGSSSLKLALVEGDKAVGEERRLPPLEGDALRAALGETLEQAGSLEAAGHRVVHGGERFSAPMLVDDRVVSELEQASELAPLHNPPALRALHALRELRPELPAVACFDTAFHSTLPPAAYTYALPAAWSERWPLRRFGFHGLSHGWIARRVPELAPGAGRIVSCHLGAGASLAAIMDGRSVDTTMGFTPLEGLVMATRAGSLDPGLLLWVQRHGAVDPEQAERALDRESGLLGLSRRSADMREVIAAADAGDEASRLALDTYLHRLRAGIAAMGAAMGGLDALAFTGGVGEASARVRAGAMEGMAFLGVELDEAANREAAPDAVISPTGSAAAVLVLRAHEELEIAREVQAVLGAT
jgi:acetate kinase